MKLRLHTRHQNSAGERVRIVLNLKEVDYEYVPIPSLTSPEYREINPQGLMPLLEVDGTKVSQSLAIIELLEELFPEPSVYPANPLDRAQARAFSQVICSDLHPINVHRVRKYLGDVGGADDEQQSAWYQHWVAEGFASLETLLAKRDVPYEYCFGERPSVADACLVPQMDNARRFNCDLRSYPLLVAVDRACRRLQAFQNAAPSAQPDYPKSA
ncbi:MAG: maleylacetoacetate isomerase [Pseudomonadota bacterium]